MSKTIFIGDVHGCIEELESLWSQLSISKGDRVIQVGDLINKGPSSREVIQFCIKNKIESILGNHEIRMLSIFKDKASLKSGTIKDYEQDTWRELKTKDWEYLQSLNYTISLKKEKIVVVHAGFLPAVPLEEQSNKVMTKIQVIDASGKPHKRAKCPDGVEWSQLWRGPPFVIYGHTPKIKIDRKKWSLGLDTSCVYGHKLSAYILESDEWVQVNAKKCYSWNRYISPYSQCNES